MASKEQWRGRLPEMAGWVMGGEKPGLLTRLLGRRRMAGGNPWLSQITALQQECDRLRQRMDTAA
jgi:hypothetical protein